MILLTKVSIGNMYAELIIMSGVGVVMMAVSIYTLGLKKEEREFVNTKIRQVVRSR